MFVIVFLMVMGVLGLFVGGVMEVIVILINLEVVCVWVGDDFVIMVVKIINRFSS